MRYNAISLLNKVQAMSFTRKTLLTAAVLSFTLLSGCAYRADLAQGNYVEQENVDRLRYGMSAEQVRFILGTPMLVDPFDSSRWYYVHYLREGWDDPQVQNLIVLFQGSTLVDMTGDFKKPALFGSGVNDYSKVNEMAATTYTEESAAHAADVTGENRLKEIEAQQAALPPKVTAPAPEGQEQPQEEEEGGWFDWLDGFPWIF